MHKVHQTAQQIARLCREARLGLQILHSRVQAQSGSAQELRHLLLKQRMHTRPNSWAAPRLRCDG